MCTGSGEQTLFLVRNNLRWPAACCFWTDISIWVLLKSLLREAKKSRAAQYGRKTEGWETEIYRRFIGFVGTLYIFHVKLGTILWEEFAAQCFNDSVLLFWLVCKNFTARYPYNSYFICSTFFYCNILLQVNVDYKFNLFLYFYLDFYNLPTYEHAI